MTLSLLDNDYVYIVVIYLYHVLLLIIYLGLACIYKYS